MGALILNPIPAGGRDLSCNFMRFTCFVALELRNIERIALLSSLLRLTHLRGCIQKFPDWPLGARTANGTALCH
jgi:hypothetical protein